MYKTKDLLPGLSINPQTIQTKLGVVEYDLTEGDGPVVLVSHGGIGGVDQARIMSAWVDTSKYRVLSVSRPGYLGTPLESGQSMEAQADLFAALLDELGVEKAAIVSASAGGPPAYMFAIRQPQRCWGLVAIDSVSGYYDMPSTAGPIAQAIFTSDLGQKLLKMIGEKRPDMFLKQIFQAEALFTKKQFDEHLEYAMGSEFAKSFVLAFMESMNPYKPRKVGTDNDMEIYRNMGFMPVDQIKCPSLIIHGTHDADVKFYDAVYVVEHLPGARRHWIEEGSHIGFWISKNGAAAQDTARAFLDEHAV